jgi:hypothetical protein
MAKKAKKKAKEPKRQPPRLVPADHLDRWVPEPVPALPCGPRLQLYRRVPAAFEVVTPKAGDDYWLVGLLNENTELRYRSLYTVAVPKKSKLPPWEPQELAVACAKRLSEYRGVVALQEFRGGVCVFAATFASNSTWTFCVWSTDPKRCPAGKAKPDGWEPGRDFPAGIPRKPGLEPHHPAPADKDPKFCKLAQGFLP